MDIASDLLPEIEMNPDPYTLAEDCDALMIVTEWNEFKQLDLARLRDLMRHPVVLDGRNIYNPEQMKKLGFYYRGFGRGYDGKFAE
jgi:UDPglucose 6-dehydrogenase